MIRRKRFHHYPILPLQVMVVIYISVSLQLLQQQSSKINSTTVHSFTFIHSERINAVNPWQQQRQRQKQKQKQNNYMSSIENDDLTVTTSPSDNSSTNNGNSLNSTTISTNGKIQFLGKGIDAIVRLGTVLVAPQNEFHHFYRQAAIFIYAMGYDETMPKNNDDGSSSTYYIRGVILDHPTPFTVQEMIPTLSSTTTTTSSSSSSSSSLDSKNQQRRHPLASNLIFRGGDKGRENSVLLLHNQKNIPGSSDVIGTSGIYHGGFDYLTSSSHTTIINDGSSSDNDDSIEVESDNFKFFFNYCEFTEEEIEELFASTEDGDSWASVQILDPSIILNEEWDRGDCWRYIRNSIVQQQMHQETQ